MDKDKLELVLGDEHIVWKAGAEKFKLLNKNARGGILIRWALCLVLLVGLSALYIGLASKNETEIAPILFVIEIVVFGVIAIYPILDRNNIIKKFSYMATEKRIIIAQSRDKILEINRAGLKYKIVEGASEGAVNVLLGTCTTVNENSAFRYTFRPKVEGDNFNTITGAVIYNVKDTPELRQIFN